MIISHRGLWAAAAATLPLQLILFGGGDAAAALAFDFDLDERQATANTAVYFPTEWAPFSSPYALQQPFKLSYTVQAANAAPAGQDVLAMVLLWTSATDGTPTSGNTFSVMSPSYGCDETAPNSGVCSYLQNATGSVLLNLELNTAAPNIPKSSDNLLQNFFMCLATEVDQGSGSLICESYSPFFDIKLTPDTPSKRKRAQIPLAIPSTVMSVIQQTQWVLSSGAPIPASTPAPTTNSLTSPVTAASNGGMTTIPAATVSLERSGTTTVTPSPTHSPGEASAEKSSKGGLPTGAIIGIAIGGFIILVAALLVAFFCFRRRRRTQNQPEQVLLTHNMHNGSRDLIGEKEGSEGPMLSSILETRPSSGGPYDHLSSSAPYNGPARPRRPSEGALAASSSFLATGEAANLTPQRNPTSATQNTFNTNISRGISDASGPISPRSTVRGDVDYDEPYHDVPIYGDARHIPQVYPGTLQAPFLSEPGMTDDELTRLEEEERRIDAAIAEAERRR